MRIGLREANTMKPRYLGDGWDIYKRWFLREIVGAVVRLEDVWALPMFTESPTPADLGIYEALLGCRVASMEVFPDARTGDKQRTAYWNVVLSGEGGTKHLFLDPDTGLRASGRQATRTWNEYVFHADLTSLLPPDSKRIVAIYDHSTSRGDEIQSAKQKVDALAGADLQSLAYSAQVALIVVARVPERLAAMGAALRGTGYLPPSRILGSPAVEKLMAR